MKKYLLILMVFIFIFFGCSKEKEDDKLTLLKTAYSGNQLRVDGYFYRWIDGKISAVNIFYRNGVLLDFNSPSVSDFSQAEAKLFNPSTISLTRDDKFSWGLFLINGNNFTMQKLIPDQGPTQAFTYEGVILNDTTFNIKRSYRLIDDIDTVVGSTINWTFHFKQFAPKPDSANSFI